MSRELDWADYLPQIAAGTVSVHYSHLTEPENAENDFVDVGMLGLPRNLVIDIEQHLGREKPWCVCLVHDVGDWGDYWRWEWFRTQDEVIAWVQQCCNDFCV